MVLSIKKFSELTTSELLRILQLRSEVFVVEQNCVYQDLDEHDEESLHVQLQIADQLRGYSRIYKAGPGVKIGRVVVRKEFRGKGYGLELMRFSLDQCNQWFSGRQVEISAQEHLRKFYNGLGFVAKGEVYDEDGIPHIRMLLGGLR